MKGVKGVAEEIEVRLPSDIRAKLPPALFLT